MAASRVLVLYAAFLAVGGLAGFVLAGFSAKARSGLIVGGGAAALAAGCALLAGSRAAPGRARLGAQLGRALAGLLMLVFAWRAALAAQSPEKAYLARILAALAAGSLVALVGLLRAPLAGVTKAQ